jgi:ribulose kinase
MSGQADVCAVGVDVGTLSGRALVVRLSDGALLVSAAAVMAEDVARTVHIARHIGQPVPIASETIDALFDRYQNVYGQQPQGVLS